MSLLPAVLPLQVAKIPPYVQAWLHSEAAYLVLFGVFVLEGAMLMYLMPSEAIVPGAILLMGENLGTAAAVIAVAVAGATVGQCALFLFARRGGREYLLEKRWIRVSPDKLDRFDGWFERWGPLVVPVSNTLPFTRGMLTIPAGFAEMEPYRFALISALGTLVFESLLAAVTLGVLGWS